MLAHFDIMVFALESGMYMSMFECHSQPLLARRHDIRQVIDSWINARVEQHLQLLAVAEEPGIAICSASDYYTIDARGADALRGLVQVMDIAVAEDQGTGFAHDFGGSCNGIPVRFTFIVLHKRAPMQRNDGRLEFQQFLYPVGNHNGVVAQARFDRNGQQAALDTWSIAPDAHPLFIHLADALDALRFHFQVFQCLTVGPVAHALLCCADDSFGRFWHANQRCSPTFVGDGAGGTAHIDIDAVEAQLTDDVRGLVEVFGAATKNLRHDGPFRRRV